MNKRILETKVIETFSPEETFSVAHLFGQKVQAGEFYTLDGDLGVGKTVFAQGFAKGLGIRESVSSPTFTILQIYENGRLPLYHFDVYRIAEPEEMEEIGYEDYFYGKGICLVEWASKIEEILPETYHAITIEKDMDKGFDYRKITIKKLDRSVA